MTLVPAAEPAALSSLLALVPDQVPEAYAWEADLVPIVAAKKGRGAAIAALAERRGVPAKTVRKKFDAYVRHGLAGLIDRRKAAALWDSAQDVGLPDGDQQLVKQWCEAYQRNSAAGLRGLLEAWRRQRVTPEQQQRGLAVPQTRTPLNPLTGFPRGWTLRNLRRYQPTTYELKAARIGRGAARSHLPLVYTTRAKLYVGQFYLWDDIWHDHEVVDLDQAKRGRPLEFHGLDLKSACKFAWGNRTRVELETKHEGLKEADFRFVLASALAATGYHPDGTTNVIEHGTTNITEEIERILFDATGGAITFARGGMDGAAAHAGQYAGRSKGNFRFKAALESLGNLIHNELAYLPGQTGLDRRHAPEEQHGRQRHTDALLCALTQLPPERAVWLQWDYCTIQQFRLICEEVYARINRRTAHDLEGWDELYVPDTLGGMRRLSPHEVFTAGRRALRPIDEATLALLLGHEQGTERTVRDGKIVVNDGEVSGDALLFDATALPDRAKFLTVLNPFAPDALFVFDARGRFVRTCRRLVRVDRAEIEAVQREMGRAAKQEAEALTPLRARHLGEARARAARAANNAAVLGGTTPADRQRRRALGEFDPATLVDDAPTPAADADFAAPVDAPLSPEPDTETTTSNPFDPANLL